MEITEQFIELKAGIEDLMNCYRTLQNTKQFIAAKGIKELAALQMAKLTDYIKKQEDELPLNNIQKQLITALNDRWNKEESAHARQLKPLLILLREEHHLKLLRNVTYELKLILWPRRGSVFLNPMEDGACIFYAPLQSSIFNKDIRNELPPEHPLADLKMSYLMSVVLSADILSLQELDKIGNYTISYQMQLNLHYKERMGTWISGKK